MFGKPFVGYMLREARSLGPFLTRKKKRTKAACRGIERGRTLLVRHVWRVLFIRAGVSAQLGAGDVTVLVSST